MKIKLFIIILLSTVYSNVYSAENSPENSPEINVNNSTESSSESSHKSSHKNSANTAIDNKMKEAPKHAVGFNAGWVIGNGLIYRQYQGRNIYQATFAGLIDKDKNEEYVDVSASYAYYLNKFNFNTTIGIKAVVGAEAIYDKSDGISDHRVNLGAGIGMDIGNVQKEGVVISFDLFYAAGFEEPTGTSIQTLSLKSALGLMYNF